MSSLITSWFTIGRNLLLTIGLFLACLTRSATAADGDRCSIIGAPAGVIPFQLVGGHIYATAGVNGTGPYRFLVDTGGVNLIDTSLARMLSLKFMGTETGRGTGPKSVETFKTTVARLTVGDTGFKSQKFYTFDFQQLYAGGGVKMSGIVGAPLFRQYVTCIDFEHDVIELIAPAHFDAHRAGVTITMSVKESEIIVPGSFDGEPGVFQIDTGSPTSLTLDEPFVARHQLLKHFRHHIEASSGGVGGSTAEYDVRGEDLVLGAARIEHPITALSVATRGQFARGDLSGNVGIGSLRRFVVTFDFPGKRLFLKPYPRPPRDLDTYDRSGMRIDFAPQGFRVVFVADGTPAADAGLRPGDFIVAVDDHAATTISLPDMRDELRRLPAGTVITIDVKAGHKVRRVRLKLRELL